MGKREITLKVLDEGDNTLRIIKTIEDVDDRCRRQ